MSTTTDIATLEGLARIAADVAPTDANVTETHPAYAADTLGETITLTYPTAWADRVRALVPLLAYGPYYSRGVIETLADMSRCVRDDYSTVAYDHLLSAERIARRSGLSIPDYSTEPVADVVTYVAADDDYVTDTSGWASSVDTFADVKASLIHQLLWLADHAVDPNAADQYAAAAEDVNLWTADMVATDHAFVTVYGHPMMLSGGEMTYRIAEMGA